MKRKKLIFIGNSLKTMLNFRSSVLYSFEKQGYHVVVIAPFDCQFNQKQNISYINFGSSDRSISLFQTLNQVIRLRGIFKSNSLEEDLFIFAYSPKVILLTLLASLGLRCNLFTFFIGLGALFLNKKLFLIRQLFFFLFRVNKNIRKIICLNKADFNKVSKHLKYLPCYLMRGEGLNSNFYSFIDENKHPLRFIIVSRPLKEKGVLLFLEAVKFLKIQLGVDAKFAIYGFDESSRGSDLPNYFFSDCSKLGIAIHGYVGDLHNHIGSRDVLVLPSAREGMSRVCMEMQEFGLPVIGNDVPGISDIVFDKITGLLIKNPTPQLLAHVMKRFCMMSEIEFNEFRFRIKNSERKYLSDAEVFEFYSNLINFGNEINLLPKFKF